MVRVIVLDTYTRRVNYVQVSDHVHSQIYYYGNIQQELSYCVPVTDYFYSYSRAYQSRISNVHDCHTFTQLTYIVHSKAGPEYSYGHTYSSQMTNICRGYGSVKIYLMNIGHLLSR